MHLHASITLFLAAAGLALAAPPLERADAKAGLRLIKTSPEDPGTWVTEEEKITKYAAKRIGFVDITDITDKEVLDVLSTPSDQEIKLQRAITYPTTLSHQTEANALIAQVSDTNPKSWLKTLTDFYNRYYLSPNGTVAGAWLFDTVKSVAAANPAITVKQFTHAAYNQPSIIVQIPGSSPAGLVIAGAHYDSTGGDSEARGPGADDNGSGVVVVLEALRVLAGAGFAPRDTLELHFYSGEEGGRLGSKDVFASYKAAGANVLAMMNQDMAGYSPSGKVSVYTDFVDAALTNYTKLVVKEYTGSEPTTDKCGYACSDHASARSNGFPAAYVCDEPMSTSDPFIHSPNDSYDTVMWDAVLRHSKFTVGFLVEASYL